MDDKCTEAGRRAILTFLVADMGTSQLLHLIADVVEHHANDLLRKGASTQVARFTREATILRRASEDIID